MQLLENFNMRILVYSNANPARKELILTGNLVDNPSKPELLYKYNMNGLKFKNNNINFKKVYTWQVATDTLEYYNTLKDAVSLGVIYKSNHLQATFEPAQVAPGKKERLSSLSMLPKPMTTVMFTKASSCPSTVLKNIATVYPLPRNLVKISVN